MAISAIITQVFPLQVAEKIRTNTRVTVLERTNLRYLRLEDLPERLPVDMVTLDLSFISVLTVIPDLQALMVPKALLVVLIKPQFEAGRRQVSTDHHVELFTYLWM